MNTEGYCDTVMQGYRETGIQGYRVTRICTDTGIHLIQRYINAGIQCYSKECRDPGKKKYRNE